MAGKPTLNLAPPNTLPAIRLEVYINAISA